MLLFIYVVKEIKDSLYLSSMCVSVYMYLNAINFIAAKLRKLNAIVHDHAIG